MNRTISTDNSEEEEEVAVVWSACDFEVLCTCAYICVLICLTWPIHIFDSTHWNVLHIQWVMSHASIRVCTHIHTHLHSTVFMRVTRLIFIFLTRRIQMFYAPAFSTCGVRDVVYVCVYVYTCVFICVTWPIHMNLNMWHIWKLEWKNVCVYVCKCACIWMCIHSSDMTHSYVRHHLFK